MCMPLPFWTTVDPVMTLAFDLSTSKSNLFIFVPKCAKIVNLVKFPMRFIRYHIHKLSGLTHLRTANGQRENVLPPAANDGGVIQAGQLLQR